MGDINVDDARPVRRWKIIKTEETNQETVDGIISRVYAPGLLYQGQVIKNQTSSFR